MLKDSSSINFEKFLFFLLSFYMRATLALYGLTGFTGLLTGCNVSKNELVTKFHKDVNFGKFLGRSP